MENVVDCGTPLNPTIVTSQLTGAAIMHECMRLGVRDKGV
jgi:CO/xanthine dehydrogenase Mo-binding subunit